MTNYSDYSEGFEESLFLLISGVAKLKKRRSKNWYEKLKDFTNALVGGGLPSLDPGISRVKSKTNIYSGAEAMNQGARSILDSTTREYKQIHSIYFNDFYQISENILKIKEADFSFENKFSSNKFLIEIRQLFIKLKTADDTVGLFNSEDAPRNLVIKILQKITSVINLLSYSLDKNISFLNSILNDLENNELSDYLKKPLLEVCEYIYVFDKLISPFAMVQPYRKLQRSLQVIEDPVAARGVSADSSGEKKVSPDSHRYLAEGFLEKGRTSLESIGRNNFKLSSLEPNNNEWSVPIILSRIDGKNISAQEIDAINNNPIRFVGLLIKSDVLNPVNIDADVIIRNIKTLTATPIGNKSKLLVYIGLHPNFKQEAYNEVTAVNDIIFQINDIKNISPKGFVIKANKNNNILKQAETATTPYYETVSPSGEKISFTPSDLVRGMGKLKDSSGNSFKPKKIKGKSLADKVMSKNFGKIKK